MKRRSYLDLAVMLWGWLACIALSLTVTGCSGNGPDRRAGNAATTGAIVTRGRLQLSGSDFPLVVTDVLGHETRIESEPRRIVSLTPANTEILFAIGAGDQLVGVTTYCNYPNEANEKDKVGGFSPKSISIEKIVKLQADLVIAAGGIQGSTMESLRRLDVAVLSVEPTTFDDLFATFEALGRITGHHEEAGRLTMNLRDRMMRIEKLLAPIPAAERVRVFYQVAQRPLMTAGDKSFIGQLVERAGGVNIFADLDKPFPYINEEAVLSRNPQVILAPTGSNVKKEHGWERIDAVRSDRVYYLDADVVSRPGPRLLDGVEAAARAIYPRYFSDSSKEQR